MLNRCLLALVLLSAPLSGGCGSGPSKDEQLIATGREDGRSGSSQDPKRSREDSKAEEALVSEDEHPFWTVVFGVAGLAAALLVGVLLAGGF